MEAVGLIALCYHKVGTEADEGRRLNVHPDRLDSHIRYFSRRGFTFCRASETDVRAEGQTVCFTFDDGFVSTLENGVPVFERHRVPMTVYIVSALVGSSSDWEGDQARPLADWGALRELQDLGHEVGNHTRSHPKLAELPIEQQFDQIESCRLAMLEAGLRSESFCYPYGSLKKTSLEAVARSGYRVGMALGKRLPRTDDPMLAIPRTVVAYGDSLPLLLYRLYVRPRLRGRHPNAPSD